MLLGTQKEIEIKKKTILTHPAFWVMLFTSLSAHHRDGFARL